ncbi:MAG: class I SAM-dependent methyltransferase, partial [Chloroflexi bacterium]|nr:class I SAM-dependent methyltransferase [Chloroflexota bacterium]
MTHSNITPRRSYLAERRAHWEQVAQAWGGRRSWGAFYHQRLRELFAFHVAPGRRVLELGCGQGDLLASLKPSFGLGVDFSPTIISLASQRHPDLHFIVADAEDLPLKSTFDVIILSDLVNDLWDVQTLLERLRPLCGPQTRILLNFYSRVWEIPIKIGQSLSVARPTLLQNWLTLPDMRNLLLLTGYEVIRNSPEIIFPLPIPL